MKIFENRDCMEGMKDWPDKHFELAIVDPPYFSGPEKREFYGQRVSSKGVERVSYKPSDTWIVPDGEYFNELMRVSKNQIVWGCNYFDFSFGSGRIVWDKCNGVSSYSDAEIAYCSLHDSVRLYKFMWNGMLQGKGPLSGDIMQGNKKLNEKRIHPTQKPLALYRWLLKKYAKAGDKLLDTHVGSASSLIAFELEGFDYVGYEINEHTYHSAGSRMERELAQTNLFRK